ncbi:hypothetical protein [Rhizobium phaseoli]|uniref:hypothetical protein n=1 Tax=Rhizobium phaseoli TaxID=396 RepID=UPI000D6CCE68|nr:hypothetical protein [Rhizobium phaseoli]
MLRHELPWSNTAIRLRQKGHRSRNLQPCLEHATGLPAAKSFYSQPQIDMDGRVVVSALYGALRIQPKASL